jgi:glycosyltransferase involved in cell wall biosynthesis
MIDAIVAPKLKPEESRRPLIAHVLNGLRYGGNENLCLQLIRQAPPGFRHVLVNLDPSSIEMNALFQSLRELGTLEQPYSRKRRIRFVLALARDFRRLGVDGVIVYPFGLHVFVAMAAALCGVKKVLVHAGNPPPLDEKHRRLWKRILFASRVLRVPVKSCSAMVDGELRALGDLPPGSEAIPNGVEVERVEATAARERAKKQDGAPRVVGMVARFNKIKDHDTLLKAFAILRKRIENSELWLIGDGERRGELMALADKLKINDAVRFWGDRPDVHRLLGGMDVFAFSTTRDEGFGIALAEAMAARTPIVASNVHACREVLGQGEAGLLVTPKDADELATAIFEFLTEPEKARAFSDRSYARVKEHLDIHNCAARFYSFFAT